jgi:uncharacterized protein
MHDQRTAQQLSDKAMALYFASHEGKAIEQRVLGAKAAQAQKPLRWAAISQTILPVILYFTLSDALEKGDRAAWQLELALSAIAAAFWAVYAWSIASPLPAAIVGFLLFTTVRYAGFAVQGLDPKHGNPIPTIGIFAIVNMVFLVKAIMAGSLQRRKELAAPPSPDGVPGTMPGGIASGMWLYLMLLSIVVIGPSLAADRELGFSDQFKIYNFMAIVVATWAIIAWRDTLPAYLKVGEAKWYGLALVLPVISSLFASVYSQILGIVLGIRAVDLVSPFFEHRYGWPTVIGLIAIFPAIFEEMAFRGVIVPCFRRVLTERETIIVTGIMFMALHLSVFSAPHLLFLGCALAYVRLRSGSIWPCILIHFLHNSLVLALGRFF